MNQKLAGAHKLLTVVLLLSGILLTVYFLFWHFRLGRIRYFDIDEFAHLHWTAQLIRGEKPYVDFLLFFPPGFYWILAPVFLFGWGTVQPILTARVVMFIVFILLCIAIGFLFFEERKSAFALVVPLILAFLPMPFDKFLEIRPDTVAVLFLFIGIISHVRHYHTYKTVYAFIAGLSYALSLIVLTKMIPPVAYALTIYGISVLHDHKLRSHVRAWAAGFFVPLAGVALWLLSLGSFHQIIYALVQLPLEANKISESFIMMPDLFFYPNAFYYGHGGYWYGLYVNHMLWIIGLSIAIFRLCTPYMTQKKGRVRDEILINGIFFLHVVIYVQFIPLKHTQYLIPIAVGIAYYVADGAFLLWQALNAKPMRYVVLTPLFLAGAFVLYSAFTETVTQKRQWTNTADVQMLQQMYAVIPSGSPVVDLAGFSLYYPSPYPVCCLPFGQFSRFLSRKLPMLREVLERTKTQYIIDGGRLQTLAREDQAYIQAVYEPAGTRSVWKRR